MCVRSMWRRLLSRSHVRKILFILSPFKHLGVLLLERTPVKVNKLMSPIVIPVLIKIMGERALEMSYVNVSNLRRP